jgi:isopentenyldiphosphate isomerase
MIEWEIDELACLVCDKPIDDTINNNEVDEILYAKYEVSAEQYYRIVQDLLPFTMPVEAGMTGEKYHAFVDVKESRMVVRKKVKEPVA